MQAITYCRLAWLLGAPAALAGWRARTAAKAVLPLCCAVLLLCCAVLGLAATAGTAALPAQDSSRVALRANSSFAIADFDGDQQPDLVTAETERSDSHLTRYLIRLKLTSAAGQSRQSIGVTGAFGLPRISAIDVNGDHALDLVITAAGRTQPIAILLNDGRGKFSLANPSDFPAAALDWPWRWAPAGQRFQDAAILIPARTPQAEAQNARHSLVPGWLGEPRLGTRRGFPPDPPHSSPLGRAPPQLA